MSSKKIIIALAIALVAGGGTLTIPAAISAMNPMERVVVESFKVKTTKVDLMDFKAGSKYCEVKLKPKAKIIPKNFNVAAPLPAPPETCKVLKKGQEVGVKANKLITNLQASKK